MIQATVLQNAMTIPIGAEIRMKSRSAKAIIFLTCLAGGLLSEPGSVTAQKVDTLSFYSSNSGYVWFRNPDVVLQAARLVNLAPGYVREVSLALGGMSATGSARLRLFGHEGGSPAPVLEEDLIEPIILRKSKSGFERITVAIPERVLLENNQFFVAVDQLDAGVVFLSDHVEKEPFCSSDDDRFSAQVLKQEDGGWRWEQFSYLVDVVMEYPVTMPSFPMGDVAPALEIGDTVQNNRSIAWGDVNDDHYLDLLWDGRLYVNKAGERFEQTSFGLDPSASPLANLFLDANNDGKLDILVLGSHDSTQPAGTLFLGDGGDAFLRVDLDLPRVDNLVSYSLADINGDGFVDLFVGQSGSLKDSGNCPSYVWLNTDGRGFVDGSKRLAVLAEGSNWLTSGSQFVDVDHDGDPDLYVARRYPGRSMILHNDGTGFFSADPISESVHQLGAGSGGDWKDYDNDGDLDLLYPRLIHSYLHKYRDISGSVIYTGDNVSDQGSMHSLDAFNSKAVSYEERHAGGTWGDVNNDGYLDAFFPTRGDCRFAELYVQNPDHTFSSSTFDYGLHWSSAGEDGVWVDYDNDGWLDLCAVEWDRLRIYRNPGDGGPHSFVEIEPIDGNGSVLSGTSVTIHTDQKKITREITIGRGLLMGDPPRLHYGIGVEQSIDSAVVRWPDGSQEVFTNLQANSLERLVKGSSGSADFSSGASISAVPNPFSDQLHIYYSVPINQKVRLEIYDQRGEVVRLLVEEDVSAGDYSVVWDGLDEGGAKVPGGVYIYRLVLATGEVSGRAVLTR